MKTLYTKPIAKLFSKLFLLLALLGSYFYLHSQNGGCTLIPMTLQQRIQASPLIIEGEVISQESFWGTGQRAIYTLNKVKVYKIFKGSETSNIIDVITEGGTVGMKRIVHSSTLRLNVGDMGVLICIPNPFPDSGGAGYTAYGSLAGFIRYDKSNGSAHDPFTKYDRIEGELHRAIKDITNQRIREVAPNPYLNSVRNRTGFNNTSGNRNPGSGNQVEAIPTISGISPTTIASGIGSTVTITGTNFGTSQGTGFVEFKNADDGGATLIKPLSTDYVSWSATQIVVKVPSTNLGGFGAGTGQIKVTNSDPSSVTSAQTLTITYGYLNLEYDNFARMATHLKDNAVGGYTFLLDQTSAFASNTPAVNKLRTVLDRWTCSSGINWLLGNNTNAGVGDDGTNIVCFSAGLPAMTLARCTSYYQGCGTTPFDWYVYEIDVAVKSNMPAGTSWYYGAGTPSATEYDFESVMLHEMGHGHQLGHVIDPAAVMHYSIGPATNKRTLSAGEIAGSTFVKNRDLSNGAICGNSAMTLLGCGASTSAPIITFSASSTNITAGCTITFTSESLPQATSWSWNFGGGAATSTSQNPTITFNTPGTYTIALTATNAYGSATLTKPAYIVVNPLACSATNTNFTGTQIDYGYPGGGRLAGHNAGSDSAFADKFSYCGLGNKLSQLKYYFNTRVGTGNITATVWNADGAGGTPGTVLFSQAVAISALVASPGATVVTLPSPLSITGDYYIGFQITYAGSDAVSNYTNQQGQSSISTGWRRSSGGTWASYLSLYGSTLSLKLEGVFNNTPTATITPASATTFCSGGSVVLNANTGSGYTYQWYKDTVALPATSSSYTATAAGSYTVQVSYSTCSATSTATIVTVNACNNADLSNLTLSSGTLSPAFTSATTSYTASVSNATASITVTPTASVSTSTITVNGSAVASGAASSAIALNVGSNTITTIVTAQDGTTTKTYTVTVTRAPSSNADLSNLTLSSGTLSPAFASATTSYTASVSNATASITVTPTASVSTSTITVNGSAVASGAASSAIALNVGSNTITTIVTAQEGTTTKTYTVTVTRAPSSNVDLSNLTLSSGTLSPAFASATTSYTASVGNATASITVTPTASVSTSTIAVNGSAVASGAASSAIALNVGSNTITTIVTAQDGTTTKTYTVTVTRAPSSNADLSNLTLSSGTLSPAFASATTSYTASVSNATASITVTPTASVSTSTITVNGSAVASGAASSAIALNVGSNTITTIVTAQDGTTTKTYTVTVTRAPSSNADLSNLTLSSGTLSPVFASATTSYTASVSNATASITVTPTASVSTSTITVNGSAVASGSASSAIALNVGSNTITTIVTAQDGTTTKTYTVTVTRAPSSNADLSNLTLSSGALSPVFASGTTSYTASVSNATASITVTLIASVSTSTITVNGSAVASGAASSAIALNVGSNTITTIVTAQDGTTTKTYTVTITRAPSSNADLSNLTLSSGTLSPAFASITTNYTASVGNATASITVTPTASVSTSTITVNGSAVASGAASSPIALNVGSNTITTIVTAQDGTTTKTYTVTVTRAPSSNADLSNLTLSSGTLSPAFASATTSYTASVSNATASITVTPTASVSTSTITVNGSAVASGAASSAIALNVGSNTITTIVTAQDGTTTKTYTVTITRAPSSNADLSNLTLSSGTLSPAFASITTSYTASVNNATASITVTPTASVSTSTITVNGAAVASGAASSAIALNVGSNTITTIVTAQDTTTKTYTVIVTRAGASNADLSNLVLSTGTLNPAFTSPGTNYTASVSSATSSITVTPTASAPTATITVNGSAVTSGTASSPIALNVGANTITTIVTAQDGITTKTYTVTVTRDTPCTPQTWYADADGDTYGNAGATLSECLQPPGYVSVAGDCNDNNDAVNPAATEICDGIDNDCDGMTDDADPSVTGGTTYYADADGDGFGNGSVTLTRCSQPTGYVLNDDDCNDSNNAVNPLAAEVCDGIDNDCDGMTDDADPSVTGGTTYYADADGDGFGNGSVTLTRCSQPTGYVLNDDDCNDSNNAVNPLAAEVCDGIDNDCDGMTDDADPSVTGGTTYYADADGDGFGNGSVTLTRCSQPTGYVLNDDDCNDSNNAVNPLAAEVCDGIDNDCDTLVDGDDPSAIGEITYYADADGDGFGNPDNMIQACSVPTGFVSNSGDCNDSNNAVNPLAAEVCDGVDNDCDGMTDDADPSLTGGTTYYADADGDTFGDASVSLTTCTQPVGYVTNDDDCDDTNPLFTLGGILYEDGDGDGYGNPAISITGCQQAGYVSDNTDCNDNIGAINPGAPEILYDGVDNNCNAILDEGFQIKTTLLSSVCNTTLTALGSLIGITTVSSAITAYRIRVTNGTTVQIIERTVPHFTLFNLPLHDYATTYTVEVQLQRNGIWLGYYGDACLVTSPAILSSGGASQVNPSQCGVTLARINTLIATTSLPGVTGYRFKVTNITPGATGPNIIQTIDRSLHWFSLPMLTQYNYGTTYLIEVAVKTSGGYSGYGNPCEVSSPATPSLINCGGVVASPSTLVAASSVAGVTQYRFRVTRMADNAMVIIDRNTNSFSFAMVPGYTPGALYGVSVSVMTVGTWSPYGDACEITAPGGARHMPLSSTSGIDSFRATASPNPFDSAFAVNVTTMSAADVELKVYDMTGRLSEVRRVAVNELNKQQIGGNYPAGVYNIVVSQGQDIKTLRVIKR